MFETFEEYLDNLECKSSLNEATEEKCKEHEPYKNLDRYICRICNIDLPSPEDKIIYKSKCVTGIAKEIEFLNLGREIVELANQFFIKACDSKIHRGKYRKSIICACIFHAFLQRNCPQNFDTIIKWFNLNNHTANKGFNLVKLKIPEVRYLYENYIDAAFSILRQLGVTPTAKFQLFLKNEEIVKFIESKSSRRLYFILSTLIYVYLKNECNSDINLFDFAQRLNYSTNMLTKMLKNISNECPSLFKPAQ